MALNFQQVRELTNIAKAKNLVLLENFQFRFHKQLKKIKDLIKDGTIGDIRYLNVTYCIPPFTNKNNFRYNKSLGGGCFYDAACYPLKITQELFGYDFNVEHFKLLYSDEFDVDIAGYGTLYSDKQSILSHQVWFSKLLSNKIEILEQKDI